MRSAFSLIELVVVVAVIAIAASVALPMRSAVNSGYRAELASKRIEADMRRLQQDSWFNSSQVRIAFDVSADAYDLENLGNAGGTERVSLRMAPYRADIQSADFGGTNVITYRGGVPSVAGEGTVKLKTAKASYEATIASGQDTELKSVSRVSATVN
jgi:prepilin-type N-terminal cleavage/methylation domain-containing protein